MGSLQKFKMKRRVYRISMPDSPYISLSKGPVRYVLSGMLVDKYPCVGLNSLLVLCQNSRPERRQKKEEDERE